MKQAERINFHEEHGAGRGALDAPAVTASVANQSGARLTDPKPCATAFLSGKGEGCALASSQGQLLIPPLQVEFVILCCHFQYASARESISCSFRPLESRVQIQTVRFVQFPCWSNSYS